MGPEDPRGADTVATGNFISFLENTNAYAFWSVLEFWKRTLLAE